MVESGQHMGLCLPRNPGAVRASCGEGRQETGSISLPPHQEQGRHRTFACALGTSLRQEEPKAGMGCGPADGSGSEAGQAEGSQRPALLHHWGGDWWPWGWHGVLDFEQGSPGKWAGADRADGSLWALAISSSFVTLNLILCKNLALFSSL